MPRLCTLLLSLWLCGNLWATEAEWIELQLAGESFRLELAADPDSRRIGLMQRDALPTNGGMLFDFPEDTRPAIWMRNMRISLDLLYVDAEGIIRQLFTEVPPCQQMPCAIYQAQQSLRFVLELPAGTVSRLALQVGDRLALGERLLQPAPDY